ncbi:MAG: TRAP transporter small permease [Candidatus Rokubacteria bacterium]|nr:TRAP transporter small permease [Candidatus Rokubacteria bacterium]
MLTRAPARAGRAALTIADRAATAALVAAAAAVVFMTALVTVEVVGRSFFGVSTLVADEMAGYLLVALTFFGLADSLRAGAFIRVEFVDAWLGEVGRRRLDAVLLVVAFGYTVFLGWQFWGLAAQSWRFGTTSLQVSRTPIWIPQACMVVGTTILAVAVVARLARRLGAGEPVP